MLQYISRPQCPTRHLQQACDTVRPRARHRSLCDRGATLVGLALAASWFLVSAATAAGPALSGAVGGLEKDDILAAVQALRSRVMTFIVEYRCEAVKGDPKILVPRHHAKVVLKGAKLYIQENYGTDPKVDPVMYPRRIAYNGARTTFFTEHMASARVSDARDRSATTESQEYFALMMFNEPRPGGNGANDGSLISLLKSPSSRVRARPEPWSNRMCQVVDLFPGTSELPSLSVWLDAERGFLPLRQVHYVVISGERRVGMELMVDEAVMVAQDMWFAVSGRKRVHAIPPKIAEAEFVIDVEGWRGGRPAIHVNREVPDDLFDLFEHLPPGTELTDVSTGKVTTVSGSTYAAAAATLDQLLDASPLPVPERRPSAGALAGASAIETPRVSADERSMGALWTVVLVSAAAVIGVAVACWAWRRRREPYA